MQLWHGVCVLLLDGSSLPFTGGEAQNPRLPNLFTGDPAGISRFDKPFNRNSSSFVNLSGLCRTSFMILGFFIIGFRTLIGYIRCGVFVTRPIRGEEPSWDLSIFFLFFVID